MQGRAESMEWHRIACPRADFAKPGVSESATVARPHNDLKEAKTMEVKRMKSIVRGTALLLVAAAFVLSAGNAAAETSWGPRAGMSISPDQIALGAHVQLPLATNFYLVPNADVAF